MKALEMATSIVLLALSAIVTVGTLGLPYWDDFTPGPAFASFWVAGLGVVVAVLLLLETLRKPRHDPVEWPDRDGVMRVLLAVAALCLFLLALPWIGFTISAFIFMLMMLVVVQRRRIVPSLTTTVVTVGLAYSVFAVWLAIDLPKGLVGF